MSTPKLYPVSEMLKQRALFDELSSCLSLRARAKDVLVMLRDRLRSVGVDEYEVGIARAILEVDDVLPDGALERHVEEKIELAATAGERPPAPAQATGTTYDPPTPKELAQD